MTFAPVEITASGKCSCLGSHQEQSQWFFIALFHHWLVCISTCDRLPLPAEASLLWVARLLLVCFDRFHVANPREPWGSPNRRGPMASSKPLQQPRKMRSTTRKLALSSSTCRVSPLCRRRTGDVWISRPALYESFSLCKALAECLWSMLRHS